MEKVRMIWQNVISLPYTEFLFTMFILYYTFNAQIKSRLNFMLFVYLSNHIIVSICYLLTSQIKYSYHYVIC